MSADAVERRCSQGHWTPLARGVYLGHNHTPDWSALAWAGVLQGGPSAALGGRAAAHASGLLDTPPGLITILVPHGVRIRRAEADPWRFRRSRIAFRSAGSPPRVSVERTVIDLANSEPKRLVHWVTSAVGSRLTTPERLRAEAARHDRLRVRRDLEWLLAETAEGVHSPLELRYRESVERAHGLPAGVRQFANDGSYCDVYYEIGLIVELDGRRGHEGAGLFRDMQRDNRNTLKGLATLRFGWEQCLLDPCGVATQVARALANLGWPGSLSECPRCHQTAH